MQIPDGASRNLSKDDDRRAAHKRLQAHGRVRLNAPLVWRRGRRNLEVGGGKSDSDRRKRTIRSIR